MPVSKKYEKFDLNIEKLNSYATEKASRAKKKKKSIFWSKLMGGGYSLYFVVYGKRLCFVNFARPIHYTM